MQGVQRFTELGFQKAEARNIIGFMRKEKDGSMSIIRFNTEDKTVSIDVKADDCLNLIATIVEFQKELGWLSEIEQTICKQEPCYVPRRKGLFS